jgi:hypothetical protein
VTERTRVLFISSPRDRGLRVARATHDRVTGRLGRRAGRSGQRCLARTDLQRSRAERIQPDRRAGRSPPARRPSQPRERRVSAATRRDASPAPRSASVFARQEPGPSSSASPRWDSTALRSRTASLSRMWRQRPCEVGVAISAIATSASCSRTSLSSGSSCLVGTAQGTGGGQGRHLNDPSMGGTC